MADAITFQCHACNRAMRVGADKAGRKAKCPQCGTVLTIPQAPPEEFEAVEEVEAIVADPPQRSRPRDDRDDDRDDDRRRSDRHRSRRDEDDRYDDERRPRRSSNKSDWPRVHQGMKLAYFGFMTLLIAFGVNILGSLFLTFESLRDNPNVFDIAFGGASWMYTIGAVVVRLSFLGMLVGIVLVLIGNIFWLWTANKYGTLAFAICGVSSAGFAALYFLSYQLYSLMWFFGAYGIYGFGSNFNVWMLGLHGILTSFYFKGLGRLVDDDRLESHAKTLLIFGSIVVGYQTIAPIIGFALFNPTTFVLNFGAGPSFGARLTLAILHWIGVFPTLILLFLQMTTNKAGIRATR